jgi:hypothetical protein
MLPEDTKARKADIVAKLQQSQVNDHFPNAVPIPREERPKPYTDESFEEAAIQWLIKTDQVCSLMIVFVN